MAVEGLEATSDDMANNAANRNDGKVVSGGHAMDRYEELGQLSTLEEAEQEKPFDLDDDQDTMSELNSVHSTNKDGTASSNRRHESPEEQLIIAKKESQAIFRLKFAVLAVLVGSMIGVALVVYFFMARQEHSTFVARYDDSADKVFESVGTTLHLTLGAIDALLVEMVAFARFSNMTWPFVTVPDIAVQLAKIRSLSHAFLITEYVLVSEEERVSWEKYASTNNDWVHQSIEVQKGDPTYKGIILENYTNAYNISDNFGVVNTTGPYLPSWQAGPVVPRYQPYNWDGLKFSPIQAAYSELFTAQRVVIAKVSNLPDPADEAAVVEAAYFNDWAKDYVSPHEDPAEPESEIYYPILDTAADAVQLFDGSVGAVNATGTTVGIMAVSVYWRDLLKGILPSGTKGVIAVIGNECGQMFTYQINGPNLVYLGQGDRHDHRYNSMGRLESVRVLKDKYAATSTYTGIPLTSTSCPYWISLYPSKTLERMYTSHNPILFAFVSACIFLFTSVVFLMYDVLVERRQRKVLRQALQTSAIVSSLFPSVVRERMFRTNDDKANGHKAAVGYETPKNKLKVFMRSDNDKPTSETTSSSQAEGDKDRPIADLFTDTTVLFADISGFTAWSSVRQPSQVFILLENLYGAFDRIATRRNVFKVETIGDSYVAVTGLPEPRADHAVLMAKFASDCLDAMARVTRQLESTLGPETGDLALRIGLNSGPVTAGVLRGQKTRFQLFGDTVNTAARMESTGIKNRIQTSQSTADLLTQAGKGHWIKPRRELVEAKGKGKMQTFWVELRKCGSSLGDDSTHNSNGDSLSNAMSDKTKRLVDWNVGILSRLVQQIIARRNAANAITIKKKNKPAYVATTSVLPVAFPLQMPAGAETIIDEVKEIIELPQFDIKAFDSEEDPSKIELTTEVQDQLQGLVSTIAATYNNNPFHNFEHASHVTMSVVKLLSRIVAPDKVFPEEQAQSGKSGMSHAVIASSLHDHTYGITSDPLTQFACVFAALIHDADHPGVPNTVLVAENTDLSQFYKGKSVAEQNSVDISFNIFADDRFVDLRANVCPTEAEARRFRQLVVNAVMATDIMDKDLKALRNARWDKAFHAESQEKPVDDATPSQDDINRKATIVIEHLIQASDVAHTMQHWHIYRKWNERLFEEMYLAYKAGRTKTDPAEFWFKGEIGFFDFYIIPLAKKLSECGVFGVSSDEYLNYAQKNREEWLSRGEEIVASIVEKLSHLHTNKP